MSYITITPKTLCWLVTRPPRDACLSRSQRAGPVEQVCKGGKPILYGVGHLSPLFIRPYLYLQLCGLGSSLSPNAVEEVINSGILGKPRRLSADFSMGVNVDAWPASNRMVNLALGGGSLLDMSAYPSVWAMLLVHRHPLNTDKTPGCFSAIKLFTLALEWTSIRGEGFNRGIECDEGDLVVVYPPYQPESFYIRPRPSRFPGHKDAITSSTTRHHSFHDGNNGMPYEANEVVRCIKDGKIESERMPREASMVL
nr:hypothetical protein I308_06258 [Cryptococcus tetragattii IND107]